jgi:hypothetical protein
MIWIMILLQGMEIAGAASREGSEIITPWIGVAYPFEGKGDPEVVPSQEVRNLPANMEDATHG